LPCDGVGRVHGVERAVAGAAAHIAGQAIAQASRVRGGVVKKAAAKKRGLLVFSELSDGTQS
jgi:hypothetical protein